MRSSACSSSWLRLDGLDRVATADEGYWMRRTVRLWAALARGDLASTYRAGHPGVTVMWAGLAGIGPARLTPFLPERFIRFEPLEWAPSNLEAFSAARETEALPSRLRFLAVTSSGGDQPAPHYLRSDQ